MSTSRLLDEAHMCFGCGPDNPIGLQLRFSLDAEGRAGAVYTGSQNHVGYNDVIHGGIIFTALDDVMSNALAQRGKKAVTTTASVSYRKALLVGQTVQLLGWIERERMFLAEMKGEMRLQDGGDLIAEATATFMILQTPK